MKILHIVSSLDPRNGGVTQAILNIISYTNTHIKHEVLCMDDPDNVYIKESSIKIHSVGKGFSSWNYNYRIRSWLKSNLSDYDLVILHGLWQYQSHALVRCLKEKNNDYPKIYIMPHGMLDPYFQTAPDRKIKAIRNSILWLFIENKLINRVDGILFTCDQELFLARNTFKSYKPKSEINIGLGVKKPIQYNLDLVKNFFTKCPNVSAEPYWLFLGRINPKKGVDLLVEAYLRLSKKNQKLPHLVIAGPGAETTFGKALVEKAKDNSRIHFTGMLDGETKWGAFYGSEAFILPSHQENFGISVVEALGCSKPVLISNQINIFPEILKAEAGFVKNDTIEGTIELLTSWMNLLPSDREIMRTNALSTYERDFSIESAAAKFLNFIHLSIRNI